MPERYSCTQSGNIYVLRDEDRDSDAMIDPNRGNNVIRFRVAPTKGVTPFDVFVPPIQQQGGLGAYGYGAGNPILFPFPNRVTGGRYVWEGQEHQFDINETARGNHIHGLVANRPWEVQDSGADATGAWLTAAIQLDADPEIVRQYPFPCTLTVKTRLENSQLTQETTVQNTGPTTLPMGYGTHPWFHATFAGSDRNRTEVKVPCNRYWELENLVPTGRTFAVSDDPAMYDLRAWHALDGNEYDHVFTDVVRRPDGWSEAGIHYPDEGLILLVEAGPMFRDWVIFAPHARPVICLEPYTMTTNAVNLQPQGVDAGLIVLQPGESWTGIIRTSLHRE